MTNYISNYRPVNTNYYAPKAQANKAGTNWGAEDAQKSGGKTVNGIVRTEPISAEKVASNILNHVAKGLDALRRSGASEEKIQERLEQAKAGIEKGYAEAKEILKSMGMLTEELSANIAKGRDLVNKGIEDLSKNKNIVTETVSAMQAQKYKGSASMQLEMRTLEGDIVKISFQQRSEAASSKTVGSNEDGKKSTQQFSALKETGWEISVNGHLSEKELESLSKVINGVQKLGASFFSGDLSSAMEQANKLGMGADQLASFSLSMQQTQTYQSVSAYESTKKSQLPDSLKDFSGHLANFADQVKQTFKDAQPLADSNKLLKQLTEKMWQGEQGQPALLKFMDAFSKQLKS